MPATVHARTLRPHELHQRTGRADALLKLDCQLMNLDDDLEHAGVSLKGPGLREQTRDVDLDAFRHVLKPLVLSRENPRGIRRPDRRSDAPASHHHVLHPGSNRGAEHTPKRLVGYVGKNLGHRCTSHY
jgi:hypothetical protein